MTQPLFVWRWRTDRQKGMVDFLRRSGRFGRRVSAGSCGRRRIVSRSGSTAVVPFAIRHVPSMLCVAQPIKELSARACAREAPATATTTATMMMLMMICACGEQPVRAAAAAACRGGARISWMRERVGIES
uniref:Uncharacterized protein n=1 Tax=Plectus sambesii TaxID=2011161 RepID=A0A914V1I9_9BILA